MSESRLRNAQGGPALEAMHRLVLWRIPTIEKFPRDRKFLLGDRIQSIALDVLERLIEATYTRSREQLLAQANLGLEKLRYRVRIASELRCLDLKRYEHAARSIDDVGRLVGGSTKANRAAQS